MSGDGPRRWEREGPAECSTHAKEVDSYVVLSPCRDCPEENKLCANYPDENGNPNHLSSTHAKEAGSHVVQAFCRDCPEDNKRGASFPDENGNPQRLCSTRAKEAGSHVVRRPCRDCPEENKLQANFPDENGIPACLCARHAEAAGSHVRAPQGCAASLISMQCLDAIERLWGVCIDNRVHFRTISQDGGATFKTIAEGQERSCLIPKSKMRPDGYCEERKDVWLFHGNYYHGFPPGHPRHGRVGAHNMPGTELWLRTMEQHDIYMRAGYSVKYIWEHEFVMTQSVNYPRRLQEVIREHATIADRPCEGAT